MKRLNLKKNKKRLNLKLKNEKTVYVSDYCVTDNKNFALFNISENFFVDNEFEDVLSFNLTENDLWMLINRKEKCKPKKVGLKIIFENYGYIKNNYFNMLVSLLPPLTKCEFYPVTEWFGKSANRLIVGLPNKEGKPIGVLKVK